MTESPVDGPTKSKRATQPTEQEKTGPEREFNGLIQHTFALRTHESHHPVEDLSTDEMVRDRFIASGDGVEKFQLGVTGAGLQTGTSALTSPALLLDSGNTTLTPAGIDFLEQRDGEYVRPLPDPLLWAQRSGEGERWERLILSRQQENGDRVSGNDFLIERTRCDSSECQAQALSQTLSEVLAQRRSMLFGVSLVGRFVNVMLPHAVLDPVLDSPPAKELEIPPSAPRRWILQPLVSLIRMSRRGDFRRMYSLTFFLIPIGSGYTERKMTEREIRATTTRAGWGLAARPAIMQHFAVSGPLLEYLAEIAPTLETDLGVSFGRSGRDEAPTGQSAAAAAPVLAAQSLPIRQLIEANLFAVSLVMADVVASVAVAKAKRQIGDDVVTSLANSRVSTALVVDERLEGAEIRRWPAARELPGSLFRLMKSLAGDTRIAERKKYRLDRPFFDYDAYAIGVLPSSRCVVCASAGDAQRGRLESGLMQAGWLAYMTIAAATAVGTIRAIYRDLELVRSKRSEPEQVARTEGEVVDLHEIYDLDITWEAYRHRYRLLRDQLGITSDYEALQGKLQARYRETAAYFEAKAQARLSSLTNRIVVLSVLILIGTIVIAVKG